jgi:hypothetical protein
MKTRTLAVHALVLSGMIGCRQGEIVAGVTDSTFVATMTALTRLNADSSLDSARRAVARDSLLQSRDLTGEALERAARALGDDPDRAVALWQRIAKESALPAPP